MIIAELPYVSDFLKETIVKNRFEIIKTENTVSLFEGRDVVALDQPEVVRRFKENSGQKLFANSENSLGWIAGNLGFSDLPRQINLFKNKLRFREFMKQWHPAYFFSEIRYDDLETADIASFPSQFIIKPAVGFFSLGVYLVHHHDEWPAVVKAIREELEAVKAIFPVEVFDHATFIAEELIQGDEYAFDAYYDSRGEAVILNIYHHPFSSGDDVSDRVYLSSEQIVRSRLDRFTQWLQKVGEKAGLKNFPLHVEVRVDDEGHIQPIEVNPLRFGGFCTTADCTWFSYGFNAYEYFFNEQRPDWEEVFRNRHDKLYSLLVLNNSSGMKASEIKAFDYQKLTARLSKPLEVRPLDPARFPLFGFVFAESEADNYAEIDYLLKSDLREFVIRK